MTYTAHRCGRAFVLPRASAEEASLVHDARILPAKSLLEVCAHLARRESLQPYVAETVTTRQPDYPDLADVKGQTQAKRALEVAAAGGHSLLMAGPPGTGKSMLAARFAGILPPMSDSEALESAALQSLGSSGFRLEHFRRRPFRAPHHSASSVALVGGGSDPRPGEISLAHHGVLFLDESEFERRVLEMLRGPLEAGCVAISRAARQAEFPARFQLIAAMNPCPCGYLGHFNGRCRCTPDQVARYRGKISGPLLDRIDIHLEVPAVPQEDLLSQAAGEASGAVRERVATAHQVQVQRQGKPNSRLGTREIDRWCRPQAAAEGLLRQAISKLNLSARAYHRVLKLARTIADLAGSEAIAVAHVAEAIQYRKLDRMV
jgi:magnesium chelatase family protein